VAVDVGVTACAAVGNATGSAAASAVGVAVANDVGSAVGSAAVSAVGSVVGSIVGSAVGVVEDVAMGVDVRAAVVVMLVQGLNLERATISGLSLRVRREFMRAEVHEEGWVGNYWAEVEDEAGLCAGKAGPVLESQLREGEVAY
jgi:hypothetical protein